MKKPTSPARIPTVLGLALLFTALFLGVAIFLYNQELVKRTDAAFQPKKVQVVNLSDHSATVVWQTGVETTGNLVWGTNNFDSVQEDDRNDPTSLPHQIHIVTLKQLSPDTIYAYKIRSNRSIYPGNTFRTLTRIDHPSESLINKPIAGKILGGDLEPVTDVLVLLQLANTLPIGVITSTAGNFLLPLADLRSQNGADFYTIPAKTGASLSILKASSETMVKIVLPRDKPLPPIILGQQNDFTQLATASAAVTPKSPFDLNSDGKINAVDLSIIITNLGKKNSPADINGDGSVNQKDVDLIKKSLEETP